MPQDKLTLAACSFEVQPKDGRIQLLPYGEFRAIDGRPHDAPAWYLTEENGRDVVSCANASRNQLVVDYEHQTLHKREKRPTRPCRRLDALAGVYAQRHFCRCGMDG